MSFRVKSLKLEGYTTFGRTATEVQSFCVLRARVVESSVCNSEVLLWVGKKSLQITVNWIIL